MPSCQYENICFFNNLIKFFSLSLFLSLFLSLSFSLSLSLSFYLTHTRIHSKDKSISKDKREHLKRASQQLADRRVSGQSSHVSCWQSSHVSCWQSSRVSCWQSSHESCWQSSHKSCWQSRHVSCWQSSHASCRKRWFNVRVCRESVSMIQKIYTYINYLFKIMCHKGLINTSWQFISFWIAALFDFFKGFKNYCH